MKTVEIIGPGGRLKVSEADLPMYMRKPGYRLAGGETHSEKKPENVSDKVLEIVEEVKKLKTNTDIGEFILNEGLQISLEDYSNIQERKAAIIDILMNRG